MGRLIQINAGQRGVELPDGGVYKAGEQITLTDDEFALVPGGWIGTLVTDLGSATDPVREGSPSVDGSPSTPSLRTLGTGAQQASPGNHSHGGGGGSGATLGSATPQPLGTAAAGTAANASREDHVHQTPASDPAAGTAGLRTLGTGAQQAAAGTHLHTGVYDPAGTASSTVGAIPSDSSAATPSLRTLGTGSTQATAGNDARLSNSRTPTTHAASHATGSSDPVSAGSIGAATSGHTHTGTYDPAGTAAAAVSAIPSDGSAGTASLRTLGTGATQAAAGNDTRLSDSRSPTGTASGSLTGSYPGPTIASGAVGGTEVAAAIKDPVAGTAGLRTLGTGTQQAAAGDHSHASSLSNVTPEPLGVASPGDDLTAARGDHIHAAPPTDPVAGTAGLRTLGTGSQQAAAGVSLTRMPLNAKDYLKGDGSLEVDANVTSLMTAWGSSKRALHFPAGTYLINPGLLVVPADGLMMYGDGKTATIIKQNANGVLMDCSGTQTGMVDTAGSNRRQNFTLHDLQLNGNDTTGSILRTYYVTSLKAWNVFFYSKNGYGLDAVELWDSTFMFCDWEFCYSTTQYAVSIQNSNALSGFGFGSDSSNALRFFGSRIESFQAGAIWIDGGTGAAGGPHEIRFTSTKAESFQCRGPIVHIGNSTADIVFQGAYFHVGGWSSGYSTKFDIVEFFSTRAALHDIYLSTAGDWINSGVQVWTSGDGCALTEIWGDYDFAPPNGHVWIAGGTPAFRASGITTNIGTALNGKPTSWATSPGVSSDIQTFTTSGTWTKPVGAQTVKVQLWGGSGGGGSGRRGPAGENRSGGGGGGGASYVEMEFPASALTATVAVTVGAAGVGGAAVTVNATNGNNGTAGGTSSFGTFIKAGPGGAGGGGTTAAGTAGGTSAGMYAGTAGGANTAGGVGAAAGGATGASGGGAGGGITSGDVVGAGGAGGTTALNNNAGGTAGAINTAGGAGNNSAGVPGAGTGGGGGGASIVSAGGAGGNGGSYGGGGGGGGASLNSLNSGKGGDGVAGWVRVITQLGG